MAPEQSEEKYVNSLRDGKERKFKCKEDKETNTKMPETVIDGPAASVV